LGWRPKCPQNRCFYLQHPKHPPHFSSSVCCSSSPNMSHHAVTPELRNATADCAHAQRDNGLVGHLLAPLDGAWIGVAGTQQTGVLDDFATASLQVGQVRPCLREVVVMPDSSRSRCDSRSAILRLPPPKTRRATRAWPTFAYA